MEHKPGVVWILRSGTMLPKEEDGHHISLRSLMKMEIRLLGLMFNTASSNLASMI
jgi:hypothetical protein